MKKIAKSMVLNIRKWLLMTCFVLTNFLSYAQDSPALIKTVWFKNTLPKLVFNDNEAEAKQIVERVNLILQKELITNKELNAVYLKYDSLIGMSNKKMSDSIRMGKHDLTTKIVSNLVDSLKEKQTKAPSASSTTEPSFWDNPLWGWITAGLLFLAASLLGWFFFEKKKELKKAQLALKNQEANHQIFIDHYENEQKQRLELDKKKKQDEELNNHAQYKKEQEEKQKNEREEQARIVEEQSRLEKQKAASQKEEQTKIEFFLSIPSADCIFSNNNRLPNYQSGRTFYRFFVNNLTDTEAEFEICEEASTFAIDKPQSHIEPACEPTNERDNSAKRIVTINNGRGKARLEGDIWRVIEKAKIRYDYT
jgi:hypothetical protein